MLSKFKNNSLYKNSLSLMLNSYLSSFLGFIFWILAAHFYNADEIGLFVAFISAASLISTISLLGFDYSIIRFLKNYEDPNLFINSALTLVTISSLFLAIVFIIGIELWGVQLSSIIHQPYYMIIFIIFSVIYALYIILNNIFIAFLKSNYYLFQNLLLAIFKLSLLIIFYYLFQTNILEPWILSIILGFIFGIYLLKSSVLENFKFSIQTSLDILSKISKFSASNYLVSILGNGTALVLPLLVLNLLGPSNNAYFYMAFTLGALLFVIPNSFSTSLFAESSSHGNLFKSKMKIVLKRTYFILIPIVLIVLLLGKYVLLIFGASYALGAPLLSYMALASLFIAINSFYNTYLRINLKMQELILITMYSSITILGLSYYFLISGNGINGVGMAYIISSFVLSVYVLGRLRYLEK